MQHLQSNSILQGGKYRIERVLGQGGFGITYLAEQVMLGRKVAIKEFFFKEYCERDERTCTISSATSYGNEIAARFKTKFLKEARIIMNLDHPNIVKVKDVFEENGTAYYVMDYIEGSSLADVVKNQGALSEAKALKYFKEVANALDYIHSKRINHLDVKPANIMIRREDGKAILIDFGVSKQYDANGSQTSSTPVGISAGFAPLEQHVAGGVSQFTPQADIYSLGATLYCMLVGKNPPSANEILNAGFPSLPVNLSEGAKAAIKAAMQVRKDDRPATINELLRIQSSSSSNRWIVLIVLIILAGAIYFFASNNNVFEHNSTNQNVLDYELEEPKTVKNLQKNEADTKKKVDDSEEIITFLWKAYSNLSYNDESWIEVHCSDKLKRKLEREMKEAYDGGEGYGSWLFDAIDEFGDCPCTVKDIKGKDGNYQVTLQYNDHSDGENHFKNVTIHLSCKKVNGVIMIDNLNKQMKESLSSKKNSTAGTSPMQARTPRLMLMTMLLHVQKHT